MKSHIAFWFSQWAFQFYHLPFCLKQIVPLWLPSKGHICTYKLSYPLRYNFSIFFFIVLTILSSASNIVQAWFNFHPSQSSSAKSHKQGIVLCVCVWGVLSDSHCAETHKTQLQKQWCIIDEWYIPGCFWLAFQLCDWRSLKFTASPYCPICLLITDLWNWVRSWLDSHHNYFGPPVKITICTAVDRKLSFLWMWKD